MKVYLSGPMRGKPYFNFPAFLWAAALLRKKGYTVFSPAERDIDLFGPGIYENNPTGSTEVAYQQGYDIKIREVLHEDLTWICREAEAIVVLPRWYNSKGAKAEVATGLAIGIPMYHLREVLGIDNVAQRSRGQKKYPIGYRRPGLLSGRPSGDRHRLPSRKRAAQSRTTATLGT